VTGADKHPLPVRSALQALKKAYPDLSIRLDPARGPACYVADGRDGAGNPVEYIADSVEALRRRIEGPLLEFDATRPSIARVYDFFLGGKNHFQVDRELAAEIERVYPLTPQLVREARRFLAAGVHYVARQGIHQFIDAGAGLPTHPATHQIAREIHPNARVAYVDFDPMVLRHAQAMLASSDPEVAAVPGDLRYPADVMARPELATVFDPLKPACVILAMALHFHDPATARRVVSGFARMIAPGSYVIISIVCGEAALGEQITQTYTAGTVHNHPPDVFRSFFDGLEIMGPGLRDAREWRPRGPVRSAGARAARVLAGVGRTHGKLPAVRRE
jgi:hypothetical protein